MAQDIVNIDAPRALPVSTEAEMALLGAILLDPERIKDVTSILSAEDFYLERNKTIFEAMRTLFNFSRTIEVVTLIDALDQAGENSAEMKSYIKLLVDSVSTSTNILDYAKIVRDKSTLRKIIAVAGEINEMAYAAEGDVASILDSAEQKIFDISTGSTVKGFAHISDVILSNYAHLQELITNKEAAMGVPTHFSGIDKLIVGMHESDLIVVGARPGMGKTAFGLNIAVNVAKANKKKVAIFSLEMSNEQVVQRMLSSEAFIDSYKMRSGELEPEDWNRLAAAAGVLSQTDIYLDDTAGISVMGMKSKLRRIKDLGLVIIDYLGLMSSDKNIDNRVQEVSDISKNLKRMAKDLKVPVIALAQLNRGVEGRTDKTPMASDLRDSGAIEQDADIIMFLYRDDYYNNDPANQNTAQCIIAKNRHGSTGKVDLGWYGQYTKFISVDSSHAE